MGRVVSPNGIWNAIVPPSTDFYRQEFLKHRQCLEAQRRFLERAITDADAALGRVLNQLEQICAMDDADRLISGLLRNSTRSPDSRVGPISPPSLILTLDRLRLDLDRILRGALSAADPRLLHPADGYTRDLAGLHGGRAVLILPGRWHGRWLLPSCDGCLWSFLEASSPGLAIRRFSLPSAIESLAGRSPVSRRRERGGW